MPSPALSTPTGGPPPLADAGALYDRYGEAVFRRALRMLRDDSAAKDAVQETFLKAHRYRASYQGGSGLSWVFTIADRVCLDVIAKRKKMAFVDPSLDGLLESLSHDDTEGAPAWTEERMVQDDLVAQLLDRADPETRSILVHRFFDELGTDEISRRTGASERTIRRRLSTFFETAKTFLQNSGPLRPAPRAIGED